MGHLQESGNLQSLPADWKSSWAIGRLATLKDKRFDPMLDRFLGIMVLDTKEHLPEVVDTVEMAKEFVMRGGKRIRPAFVYEGYMAFGGADESEIVFASMVVELLHAAMLDHDDIMDQSLERRGKLTIHEQIKEYLRQLRKQTQGELKPEEELKQLSSEARLAESKAITIGDKLIAMTSIVVSNLPFPGDKREKAQQLLSQMFSEVCDGQQLDLEGNRLDEVNEDWVLKVHEYKTARYTIEKPLLIGAALAGADQKQMQAMSEYAVPLGIAFQIQDDILGMFGDKDKVGKDVDSDLKEGKKTLLVVKAIEELRGDERFDDVDKLKSIIGDSELTEEDHTWTQEVIRETGSLEYSREKARKLIEQSKESLDGVNMSPKSKDYLLGIADYMLTREY